MCLITKQQEPIILDKDLEVYKIVYFDTRDQSARPVIRYSFKYKLNKLYSTEIKESENPVYTDAEDMSYWEKEGVNLEYNIPSHIKIFGQGYHFYTELGRAISVLGLFGKIVKCIVPKGSQVYYGHQLGVSNQIIITDSIIAQN